MGGPRGFKTMVSNANLSAETNLFRGNYLKENALLWPPIWRDCHVVANQGFMGNVSEANTETIAWTRVAWVAKHFCFIFTYPPSLVLLGQFLTVLSVFKRWRWLCHWAYITIFAGIIVKTILQLTAIKLTSSAMRDVNWSVQVTWLLSRLVSGESYKCPGGSVPNSFSGMVFLV